MKPSPSKGEEDNLKTYRNSNPNDGSEYVCKDWGKWFKTNTSKDNE